MHIRFDKIMKPRVLFISTRIWPDIGGVAIQVYLISKYLSQNDVKVFNIVCNVKNEAHIRIRRINKNYIIYYLPFQAPGVNAGIFKLIWFFIKFFFLGFVYTFYVKRKHKINLIHAISPPPTGLIAYFFNKLFRIPYIYTIHGLDYPSSMIFNLDIRLTTKNSLITFLVSRNVKSLLKTIFNLKNLAFLPNMVNVKNYYHIDSVKDKERMITKLKLTHILDKDDFIIIYVGYMVFLQKVKGMIDFLIAFSNFLNNIEPNSKRKIKLIFVGDGNYSKLLIKEIGKLNLNKNVYFLGKRNETRDLLSISDLFALTSYIEGSPNVILEAMASKVPCIGTDTGEVKRMIGKSGFIVSPGNIKEISEAIQTYYHLPNDLKLNLMEKSLKKVKGNYDIHVIGKKLRNLYENIINF